MASKSLMYYSTEASVDEVKSYLGELAKQIAQGDPGGALKRNYNSLYRMWQEANSKGFKTMKEWGAAQNAQVESKLNKIGASLNPNGSTTVQATPVTPAENTPSAMRQPVIMQGAPKAKPPVIMQGAPRKSEYIPNQSRYSDKVMQYMPVIKEAAAKYGVPEELMVRMITQESGGQVGVVSNKGARGIAQFTGDTAKKYGVDVNDPNSSIFGMAHYMRDNYDKLGSWEKATAGYNWGENRKAYSLLNWKDHLPGETKGYINNINPEDFDNPNYVAPASFGQPAIMRGGPPPASTSGELIIGEPNKPPVMGEPVKVTPYESRNNPVMQREARTREPLPEPKPIKSMEEILRNPTIEDMLQLAQTAKSFRGALTTGRPPGFGDMGAAQAGLAGMANPFEDVRSEGAPNLMNLMQMLLQGRGLGGQEEYKNFIGG